MTVDQWVQLITAIAALVGAIGSVVNRIHLAQQSDKIEEIHLATNSMKDDLVAAVKSESTAAGIEVGRQVEKTAQRAADARDADNLRRR